MLEVVPVVLIVSFAVFMLVRMVPGDPARLIAGDNATPEQLQQTREQLGLTGSPISAYLDWLTGVFRLDFGRSFQFGLPVLDVIQGQLEPTLQLAISAYVFTLVFGIVFGVLSARSRSWNLFANGIAAIAVGFPTFVLGILLLVVFAVELNWLPAGGTASLLDEPMEAVKRLVLPTIALGSVTGAVLMRFVRTAMRDVLDEDYIRTARAKGLSELAVVRSHALRNALLPVITVSALQIGRLLGGALVVEQVFARPGLGRLLVGGILARDYLLVQTLILLFVLVFVMMNLLADLLYGLADPRVRL